MTELFLEDVLEKSRYTIKPSDSGNYQGGSRGRRRDSESKKDDLTTLFEVCKHMFYLESLRFALPIVISIV